MRIVLAGTRSFPLSFRRLPRPLTGLFLLTCLCPRPGSAVTFHGRLGSCFYSYEAAGFDGRSNRRDLSYEAIALDFDDPGIPGLTLHTDLRTLNNPPDAEGTDPSTKIYSAYLGYEDPGGRGRFRAGRQFLYGGVARGKMDGIRADIVPVRGVTVTAFAGAREPEGISTKIDSWSSSHTWGGRVRVDRVPETQIGWSYALRSRNDAEEGRLTGVDVRSRALGPIDLYGRLDWDLIAGRTSRLVLRASSRVAGRLSLEGEFARNHPQIRSNSILSVVRQEAYDQVRIRPHVRLGGRWGLDGGYTAVLYEGDTTHRVNGGVSFGRGSAGLFAQTGYGGRTAGAYGNLAFDLREDLGARLGANYRRYPTVEDETPLLEAFVTSAALDYAGLKPLALSLELQEARNALLDSDFRVFVRADYRFRVAR